MYYSMARDLPLFEKLLRSAEYAIRSRSKELVYQTYGAAEMAYDLSGITKDEFYQLNDLLVRKTPQQRQADERVGRQYDNKEV